MAKKNKEYTVCGNHEVHGHAPGATFSASLTEEQEEHLINAGHIKTGKADNNE